MLEVVVHPLATRVIYTPLTLFRNFFFKQKDIGVNWYPAKYWAVAAPAFLIVIVSSYGTVYGAIGELSSWFTVH